MHVETLKLPHQLILQLQVDFTTTAYQTVIKKDEIFKSHLFYCYLYLYNQAFSVTTGTVGASYLYFASQPRAEAPSTAASLSLSSERIT